MQLPNIDCYRPLSSQEELFCREYIKDRNQTKAYIRAGYSKEGARQNASRLISKDHIRARINELLKEQYDTIKIEATKVLRCILEIADVDPIDAINEDGTIRSLREMPQPVRKAIASIAVCAAGGFSMWVTNGKTGIGWAVLGLLIIWG